VPIPPRAQPHPSGPSLDLDQDPLPYQLAIKDWALATAAEGITISDLRLPDNPLVYVNRGFTEITGYSREESIGRNCRYLQGPGTSPERVAEIRRAVADRRACIVELLNYRRDGTPFWNRLSLTPVRDASGVVTHYIGVQSDVTRGREAEDALREAKERVEQANRRMQRDLEAAAAIQRALLPARVPIRDGVAFAWHLDPCDELAGDTLNVIPLDDHHVAVYVLDVSGHGVPAALLSVTLHRWLSPNPERSVLRYRSSEPASESRIVSPDLVARQLNVQFPMDLATGQYFTLIYGVLNLPLREFRYVNAGHPPPIHVPARGAAYSLESSGFPVGVFPDSTYETELVVIAPGDRLYLFSDGLTESMNEREELFDVERLAAAVEAHRSERLEQSLESVAREAWRWRGKQAPDDDLTLLGIETS